MSKAYYGLVSGLPVLVEGKTIEDGLKSYLNEMGTALEPHEYYQCLLLNYLVDVKNVIRKKKSSEEFDSLGNLTEEELDLLLQKGNSEDVFFQSFLEDYDIPEEELSVVLLEKNLTQHYFDFITREGNAFLREWVKFEITLKNLTSVYSMRNLQIDSDDHFLEGGYFTGFELKRINIADLDRQFPFLKKKYEALEIKDPAERKLRMDQVKWEYLDEKIFFEPFSLNAVLSHQLKLMDLRVWENINADIGARELESYLDSIKENLETQIA